MITSTMLETMVEEAKKRKDALIILKNLAVKCQQFELAAYLREIENELYPVSPEIKAEKELASKLKNLFSMVEINTTPDIAWLLYKTILAYGKKKGKFSIKEASEIVVMRNEIFDIVDKK